MIAKANPLDEEPSAEAKMVFENSWGEITSKAGPQKRPPPVFTFVKIEGGNYFSKGVLKNEKIQAWLDDPARKNPPSDPPPAPPASPPPPAPPPVPPSAHDKPYDDRMEARLAVLEAAIPTLMTKSDGESIKVEIQKNTAEVQRWMIGTVIGLFVGFGGLFLAMSNALKPTPAPTTATQSPVIYNFAPGATVPQQQAASAAAKPP